MEKIIKYKTTNAQPITSGLAKWRLSPLTRNGEKSHHAGQICETPLRQAAGTLSASGGSTNSKQGKILRYDTKKIEIHLQSNGNICCVHLFSN
jgi:hypothetical protein